MAWDDDWKWVLFEELTDSPGRGVQLLSQFRIGPRLTEWDPGQPEINPPGHRGYFRKINRKINLNLIFIEVIFEVIDHLVQHR